MVQPPSKRIVKGQKRSKHIPQRTCVGCRMVASKREMVRVVRTLEGFVEVDPTGKKAGRGAYLCRKTQCWKLGLGKGHLENALEVKIGPETKAQLLEGLETLLLELL